MLSPDNQSSAISEKYINELPLMLTLRGEKIYPVIGTNVTIYSNIVIVGGISIGDGAIIGDCSFVNKNVAKNVVGSGVPVKK